MKKNVKISKENIPAATQLFTPDWIVRYMTENSLGRLWVEGHPNDELKENWKYYLEEAEQEPEVQVQLTKIREEYSKLNPEDIKVIDPCMGSGHILVYAFDVLMQIYESQGYTQREAAKSILQNNIYGLDIDDRAYQLAYFAVMMKARQYNRRILNEGINPNLCAIQSSKPISANLLARLGECKSIGQRLVEDFKDAKEYGSILNIGYTSAELNAIDEKLNQIDKMADYGSLMDMVDSQEVIDVIDPLIFQARIMAQKYDVVVTNPPYMGSSSMGIKLSEFTKKNYPTGKLDLFACFIVNCEKMARKNGIYAMITQQSVMFLGSYEKLRTDILMRNTIVNMVHLGYGTFGADFGTTAFVILKNRVNEYNASYARLAEFRNVDDKRDIFDRILTGDFSELKFISRQERFFDIPGLNFVYWISNRFLDILKRAPQLQDIATIRVGMHTGNNDVFVREWYEVNNTNIAFDCRSNDESLTRKEKWYPYNKGGGNRRWYGYRSKVVNWMSGGKDIHKFHNLPMDYNGAPVRAKGLQFKEGITWSDTGSTGIFAARYSPVGAMFDVKGSSAFMDTEYLYYVIGFLNVKIATHILNMFNPTITYQVGNISTLPLLFDEPIVPQINSLVKENVNISTVDFNCDETSWDFEKHPLVKKAISRFHWGYEYNQGITVEEGFKGWNNDCNQRFSQLKANEEELNRIFIDIYGLRDELTPEVEDKDITVRKADLGRDIRSLLSYAVGCMFGRYSIDKSGLAYAGGEWDSTKYKTFIPDKDNCIPITDEEYFEDDIVDLFCAWVKKVFGEDTLEENLDFIAKALGNKGTTSREVIRNYFMNDFIKDHIKIYQKRPIYWMFDSGKQNGFKALVYMHRWNADTIGNVRVEYLHRMQKVYENEINRMQEVIDNSNNNKEIISATKRKEKLQKQLKETKEYDAQIAHLALSRIDIDLDDGVKVNYEKVQTGRDGKKMQILAKL